MKITVEMLKAKGACSDQVELFQSLFPNGVELTEALCFEHAQKFDWNWAAENLLSPPAQKAYKEAIAPALKAYDEAIDPAQKAYDEALASARKAYNKATAPAREAFYEAEALAWKAHKEALAIAFYNAWRTDK